MKIWLATTAPGNESKKKILNIPRRLLSFYHIKNSMFECHHVWKQYIDLLRNK